jgi:glyoxylase-like metal-dependent hydrolase (beta-lactamase superfamily II)
MTAGVSREVIPLGDGLYAYVQGGGSWGWSNSGLIISGDEVMLVDTLYTAGLTRDMLQAFSRADSRAGKIDVLVNSHANGDHTFGNSEVGGARIISSQACKDEMAERPAEVFADMMANWQDHGSAGAFMHEMMGHFDFSQNRYAPPTETFAGTLTIPIGGRDVILHEVGPAHTRGDILTYLPDARTVFTGDIVFNQSHPIAWTGPIQNWIDACNLILSWNVETVVPGHGPVSDKSCVIAMRDYFEFVMRETTARFNAGMSWKDAAWDIVLDGFSGWLDRERIVTNVSTAYRELSGGSVNPQRPEIMELMLRYHRGTPCPHDEACSCQKKN